MLSEIGGGIAIDMPGVGQSEAIANLSLDIIADEIIKVCEHENMQDVHMIGHSMGGYTVLNAVQKTDIVKTISLVHSGANADNEARLKNREKSIILMEKGEREKNVFVTAMFKNFFAPAFNSQHPGIVQRYIEMGKAVPIEVLADLYKAIMKRTDSYSFLQNTDMPIQFIIGTEDTATPIEDLLSQTVMAPKASVAIYEGCGHGSFEELPNRLADDIIKFHKYVFEIQ